jgi:hypothetical protein
MLLAKIPALATDNCKYVGAGQCRWHRSIYRLTKVKMMQILVITWQIVKKNPNPNDFLFVLIKKGFLSELWTQLLKSKITQPQKMNSPLEATATPCHTRFQLILPFECPIQPLELVLVVCWREVSISMI